MMTCRREFPRVSTYLMGVMTARLERDHDAVLIRNLSLSGACISASAGCAVNSTTLLFDVPTGKTQIRVAGSVIWSMTIDASGHPQGAIMGIQFTEILPGDREALRRFIQARLESGDAEHEDRTNPVPSLRDGYSL